jgi:hypothetical protein
MGIRPKKREIDAPFCPLFADPDAPKKKRQLA